MTDQNGLLDKDFDGLTEKEIKKIQRREKLKENWALYTLPFAIIILALVTYYNMSRGKPEIIIWAEENILQTELYFFESEDVGVMDRDSIYSIIFNQDQTKYININFRMLFNEVETEKNFTLKTVFIHPDNSILHEYEEEVSLKKGDIQTSILVGYGFQEFGMWNIGTYNVKIYFENLLLTESYFKIDFPSGPPLPTPTPVPDNSGVVVVDTVTVFYGPGPEYGIIGSLEYGDLFEISGAYEGCQWIQVITPNMEVGAIYTGYIEYTLECEEMEELVPPPAPTAFPPIDPPYVPPLDSIIINIFNNTQGHLYLELFGEITHPFYFPPGEHELLVPDGVYAFYGYSCGTSENGEFRLDDGDDWIWGCD